MKYETLKEISKCESPYEARIRCDILGEDFDEDEYSFMMGLESWKRTIWLYNISCKERGVKNVLM